jgi:DNA adenine methylase
MRSSTQSSVVKQICDRNKMPNKPESEITAVPFLKWAGGKRWLARRIALVIDPKTRLIEPFVGSGAIFFVRAPTKALLADVNPDLIAAYRAVRNNPRKVIQSLCHLRINARVFERIREEQPTDDVSRAVRMIYLNRTAFNGLYRVNRKGEFNVPFGCKPGTRVCDSHAIRQASRALAIAEVRCQDFRVTLADVQPTDRVYIDPPYTVKHDNNGFRRYNEHIFTWQDQRDLADAVLKLVESGARVIASNAHHETIGEMYPKAAFHAFPMSRASCMAGEASGRGDCREFLFVSRTCGRTLPQLINILEGS